jgi:hypothetical protein
VQVVGLKVYLEELKQVVGIFFFKTVVPSVWKEIFFEIVPSD